MSQNSYNINHNQAYAGLLADTRINVVDSRSVQDVNGISFGLGVVAGANLETDVLLPYKSLGTLVFAGDFVSLNVINLKVNGVAISPVTFDTDHDTTAALLVDAIAALDGVDCTLDSSDANNRTFLIEARNTDVAVTDVVVTLGAGQTTGSTTYSAPDTFRGFVLHEHTHEMPMPSVGGEAKYLYQQTASTITLGGLWVPYISGQLAIDDNVYIKADGTDRGKATNVSSGNVQAVNWIVSKIDSGLGLAMIVNTK